MAHSCCHDLSQLNFNLDMSSLRSRTKRDIFSCDSKHKCKTISKRRIQAVCPNFKKKNTKNTKLERTDENSHDQFKQTKKQPKIIRNIQTKNACIVMPAVVYKKIDRSVHACGKMCVFRVFSCAFWGFFSHARGCGV